MGCDAHPCIEIKGRNGRWGLKDSKDRYWKLIERNETTYEDLRKIRPSYMNVLGDRNYVLFAVIADVRNHNITPLPFAGRGVPKDVAKATLKDIPTGDEDDGWSDYHSHTWFTVQELLDTDWDQVAAHDEMALFADDFVEWKDGGHPSNLDKAQYVRYRAQWHKGVGNYHRQVTEEEMTLLLLTEPVKKLVRRRKSRHGNVREKLGPYVNALLPRTYRDLVPGLIEVIPDLQRLGPPDRVRVVIAFDN